MTERTRENRVGGGVVSGIPAMPAGVELVQLPNGLQVILKEDLHAPVVSVQAWCRAGSIDEGRWLGAGLSHVLEHMLFKGTARRGPGRIDQEVQAAGGYMNAYTSFDRTVYWINVPRAGASVAVDILCDIFQGATLPEAELVKELDVIRREMDMGEDDPGRKSSRRLFETAYTRSSYRFPIIGLPDIFNRLTRAEIVDYYQEKYAPNNCFFVVVGDFSSGDVMDQIRKAWEGTRARPLVPTYLPPEPRQLAAREVIEDGPVELGHGHLAWHIPDARHPDTAALDVLSTLLGSGRSSRLYQSVRERLGLVHSVSGWTYTPTQTGLLGISAVCDGAQLPAARDAILEEVERLRSDGIREPELEKAVKQFVSGTLSSRKTMEGQAQDLGANWLLANDLNFSERYLASVKALTTDDVVRVARTHLGEAQRTLYALLPAGTSSRREGRRAVVQGRPVELRRLRQGVRLLTKEDSRLPFVEFRAVLNGGVLYESPANAGMTQLMARSMVKGTQSRTAERIADEIESVGGSLEPYSGNHSFGICAEVMREDVRTGLGLLVDVLLNPSFPEAAVGREKEVQLAGIRGQRDQLLSSAFKAMRRAMFGNRGYGLDLLGEEESVKALSIEQLRGEHRRRVVPGNTVLAVYGAIDAGEIAGELERALERWEGHEAPGMDGGETSNRESRVCEERPDKEQAVLVLGFPGVTFDHPDRFALELVQEACSDMGSRLFLRIRDELGLAYYVGASHFLGRTPGYFSFYCGTSPSQAEAVSAELRAQADLLCREGLTAAELARAKAKIIGQRCIARQDLGHEAMSAALDELYGLGYRFGDGEVGRYESVTLEDVRRVAATYLKASRAVESMIRGS